MKLWLTIDSIGTYLAVGLAGCRVWISEPKYVDRFGWASDQQPPVNLQIGKTILQHPQAEELDNALMSSFLPGIDLKLNRRERLNQLYGIAFKRKARGEFCQAIDVSPQKWASCMVALGDAGLAEAQFAQRVFAPDCPF